jgi:FkbM family methyltransferase
MPDWPGNTAARRAVKRALAPILNERVYSYVQAISMARDIRSGAFTEPEIELIPRVVKPGDTVLDVGANYGMWVYPLSRAVGSSGRVLAFEPIPFTATTLRKVTALLRLKNVEVISKGCAETRGAVTFAVPVQDNGAISGGQAHFAARDDTRPGGDRHARWKRTRQVQCEVVSIDDVVRNGARISLIKLDIEGAELSALYGCERTIKTHKPTIVCEINPWFLEGLGVTPGQLIDYLADKGYEVFRYSAGQLIPANQNEIDDANYVFVHHSHQADIDAYAL